MVCTGGFLLICLRRFKSEFWGMKGFCCLVRFHHGGVFRVVFCSLWVRACL